MGADSPRIRPAESKIALIVDGVDSFKTILKLVAHLVAPKDKDALLNLWGTAKKPSVKLRMSIGKMSKVIVNAPAKTDCGICSKKIKKYNPNNP